MGRREGREGGQLLTPIYQHFVFFFCDNPFLILEPYKPYRSTLKREDMIGK